MSAPIEEAVFSRLSSSTDVTSLVPAIRIRPSHLPQDPTFPAVTYHLISKTRTHAMTADTGDTFARIQVSSWDESYSGVKDVAEGVRVAMQRWSSTGIVKDSFLENEHDLPFDLRTETYHVVQDYRICFKET